MPFPSGDDRGHQGRHEAAKGAREIARTAPRGSTILDMISVLMTARTKGDAGRSYSATFGRPASLSLGSFADASGQTFLSKT